MRIAFRAASWALSLMIVAALTDAAEPRTEVKVATSGIEGAYFGVQDVFGYAYCPWIRVDGGTCLASKDFYVLKRCYVVEIQNCTKVGTHTVQSLALYCATFSVRADAWSKVEPFSHPLPSGYPEVGTFGFGCLGPHTQLVATKFIGMTDLQTLINNGLASSVITHLLLTWEDEGQCDQISLPDSSSIPQQDPCSPGNPFPRLSDQLYVKKQTALGGMAIVYTHVFAPNPDGEPSMTDWLYHPVDPPDCGDPVSFSGLPVKDPIAVLLVPGKYHQALETYLMGSK